MQIAFLEICMDLLFSETADPLAGLTCASKSQTKSITSGLISQIDFGTPTPQKENKISTMYKMKVKEGGKQVEYRLDSEQATNDNYAKFRIQHGKLTYTTILLKGKVDFGVNKIKQAFTEGVSGCKIVKLTTA